MKILFACLVFLINLLGYDATKIGIISRDEFPFKIEDNKSFDIASRFEILSYVRQISKIDVNEIRLIELFQEDFFDLESIDKWLIFTKEMLIRSYKDSLKTCSLGNLDEMCMEIKNWQELEQLSNNNSNKLLLNWISLNEMFYKNYLYEQIRLASLSKKITSEIFTLDEKEEQGFNFSDKEFLITFDDGPSLSNTRKITEKLNYLRMNAIFFILGENLKKVLEMKESNLYAKSMYMNMCVGSHGFIHKPFPKLNDWENDYEKTKNLILDNNLQGFQKQEIYFRPPYGQRQENLVKKVISKNDKLLLWNIDSQDWNKNLSEKQVYDRVFSLMLLYRKGIILFHDTNMKGIFTLEKINDSKKINAIKFMDCKFIEGK